MSSFLVLIVAALALVASVPTDAYPYAYHAELSGMNGPTPSNSTGTGYVHIKMMNSTYAMGTFIISELPKFFMAHIHRGNSSVNGPVLVWTYNSSLNGMFNPFDIGPHITANFTFNPNATGITPELLSSTGAYFNCHTMQTASDISNGTIRGQLEVTDYAVYNAEFNSSNVIGVPSNATLSKTMGFATAIIVNGSYGMVMFSAQFVEAVSQAHIHNGSATSSGAVLVPVFVSSLNGSFQYLTAEKLSVSPVEFNPALVMEPMAAGNTYFNIHSLMFPGGSARGQFVMEDPIAMAMMSMMIAT